MTPLTFGAGAGDFGLASRADGAKEPGIMAKSKRECPVLGEVIASARCGEERGERLAGPDDGAFNPFARRNHDADFQLEERVILKTVDG